MFLRITQIVVSILLIILVLLQERSAGGLSGIFGGESGGGVYQTRRGLEKIIFAATIVFGIIFAGLALWQLAH